MESSGRGAPGRANLLDGLSAGRTLDRYECLVPIAQGGMAAVWAARSRGVRGFAKIIALKTMLPDLSDDPSITAMFLEEATIASRVRHPHVIEVLDLGEADGVLYLVMEWVDGEPLHVLMREAASKLGGVPLPIAAAIVMDACAGLHAAHELADDAGAPLGLVHRDVSPQNILISTDGVVKVADFGIAKATNRGGNETAPGQLKGKVAYMAPEQALGLPLDRRADVFALGVVLYQLTTGKHPFRGDNEVQTLQSLLSLAPRAPRTVNANVSVEMESVVLRAMAKDAADRFATAAELAGAIGKGLNDTRRAQREEVADLVRSLSGHRAEQRRQSIRAAITALDRKEPPPERTPAPTPRDEGHTLSGADTAVGKQHPSEASSTARQRSIALPVAAFAAVGVLAGLSAAALFVRGEATPSPASRAPSSPRPEPLPPQQPVRPASVPSPEVAPAPDPPGPDATGSGVPRRRPPRAPARAPRPTASPTQAAPAAPAKKPDWSPPLSEPGF